MKTGENAACNCLFLIQERLVFSVLGEELVSPVN